MKIAAEVTDVLALAPFSFRWPDGTEEWCMAATPLPTERPGETGDVRRVAGLAHAIGHQVVTQPQLAEAPIRQRAN